jgi:alpha-glucoside transport system permease protein
MIFLPYAISFVGASVIWNFIYEVNAPGAPQIGLLNAIVVALGGDPHGWVNYTQIAPWNNLFLVLIVVWLQTGFAMVLFSAAIKGIPEELLEAARVDGATEVQIFFKIMIPYLMGTIIAVTTTIIIFTLKIFDVVWVMTGGQFDTDVIATQFYRQSFINRNSGFGSAIAIILLLAIVPVIIYNLRRVGDQEAFR